MKTFQHITISDLNQVIKAHLEYEELLQNIWIIGEISNLKYYQKGGQVYFNLSDKQAQISCVMYQNQLDKLQFSPKNGMQIIARGGVRVFHKKGTMIFQVVTMIEQGKGGINQQLNALKTKLLKEGVFDKERKKVIPKYPTHITLITAYDSAAMWDFITVSKQLMPHVKLTIAPATMQGETCPSSVIDSLKLVEASNNETDIVVILRGGGSVEDLYGFNDESLIRYISDYQTPIISAIGHEVDTTFIDFVSDLRAPTPSAAPHLIARYYLEIPSFISTVLSEAHEACRYKIESNKQKVLTLVTQSDSTVLRRYEQLENRLSTMIHRIDQTSPIKKLKQGYSIVKKHDSDEVLKSAKQAKKNMLLNIKLSDGSISTKVL